MSTRAAVIRDGVVENAILIDLENPIEIEGCEVVVAEDFDIGHTYNSETGEFTEPE